jgi:hypothetical protein
VYEYFEELDQMNWSARGNVLNQYLRNTSIGTTVIASRDLTILGQRNGDGQNKLLQINGSKDSTSYIINRMNLIQS